MIIYGTTSCAFCKVLKQWLDSKSVDYTYINVEEEPSKNIHNFSSFPVTVINKDGEELIVRGFDRKRIEELLGI